MINSCNYNELQCPWCGRGEALGMQDTQGTVSLVCPKCGKCFIADFTRCKSHKSNSVRKASVSK